MLGAPMYPLVGDDAADANMATTHAMPHRFEDRDTTGVLDQLAEAGTHHEVEAVIFSNAIWLTERLAAKQLTLMMIWNAMLVTNKS